MQYLADSIVYLRALLRRYAELGHTTECDLLHSKIATLEEAMAILNHEDDVVEGLKAALRDIPSDAAHHNH